MLNKTSLLTLHWGALSKKIKALLLAHADAGGSPQAKRASTTIKSITSARPVDRQSHLHATQWWWNALSQNCHDRHTALMTALHYKKSTPGFCQHVLQRAA